MTSNRSETSDRSPAYRIACSNQKGGVGKSTVSLNTAGALADCGNRTLLVDADPQGYLTDGTGMTEEYTAESPTLYDAFLDPDEVDIAELVRPHDEFDVLPANIDMFPLEQELVTAMRGRERLDSILSQIDSAYDFIVVDTPPSLGLLSDNSLLACQNVLIPALAEDTSIRALDILFNQIDTLEEQFDTPIVERAIVGNMVSYPLDNEERGMLDWFETTFEHIPVFEVRHRVAIKRAWNAGHSIFGYEADCDMQPVFTNVAEHLEAERQQEVSA